MMKNSFKLLFLLTLMFGTLISICSSSWFSVWMGLEINLLSFIPLSMKLDNLFSSEACLKYFLIQAMASSILLFLIIFFSCFFEWTKNSNFIMTMLFAFSLMVKSGMAPFHFWFPNVLEGLNWNNALLLMTWQKIAPIVILSFVLNFFFFNFIIFCSIFVGSISGLNQTSLRKLMAYSSINHLGWMMAGMMNNENIWKIYFLFYCFLSFTVIFLFNNFKLFNLNQIFSFLNKKNFEKTIIFISLLSLGGLPPFLGFFPKWMVIETMMTFNYLFVLFFMINFTLVTLYFYLRISYSALLMNHNEMSWNFSQSYNNKKKIMFSIILFFSIFGMLFINLFFLF